MALDRVRFLFFLDLFLCFFFFFVDLPPAAPYLFPSLFGNGFPPNDSRLRHLCLVSDFLAFNFHGSSGFVPHAFAGGWQPLSRFLVSPCRTFCDLICFSGFLFFLLAGLFLLNFPFFFPPSVRPGSLPSQLSLFGVALSRFPSSFWPPFRQASLAPGLVSRPCCLLPIFRPGGSSAAIGGCFNARSPWAAPYGSYHSQFFCLSFPRLGHVQSIFTALFCGPALLLPIAPHCFSNRGSPRKFLFVGAFFFLFAQKTRALLLALLSFSSLWILFPPPRSKDFSRSVPFALFHSIADRCVTFCGPPPF